MFQFNAMGFYGLVAVAMCWVLAMVLYRVGATGSVARKLAVVFFVEGVTTRVEWLHRPDDDPDSTCK